MASSAKRVKLTEAERNTLFMNKILAKCKYEVKKIDGEWHRRRAGGRGKWYPIVWPEREEEFNDAA